MAMNYMEWNCPACGKDNREPCSTWVYGSPIRTCGKCRAEYLDKRWREVAIDGFDPRSMNSGLYLKGTIGFAVFAAVIALWIFYGVRTNGYYSMRAVACVVMGALASVLCLVLYLRIKLGFEAKSQEKYLQESAARLRDPAYVQKLMQYGYTIPPEFAPAKEQDETRNTL